MIINNDRIQLLLSITFVLSLLTSYNHYTGFFMTDNDYIGDNINETAYNIRFIQIERVFVYDNDIPGKLYYINHGDAYGVYTNKSSAMNHTILHNHPMTTYPEFSDADIEVALMYNCSVIYVSARDGVNISSNPFIEFKVYEWSEII